MKWIRSLAALALVSGTVLSAKAWPALGIRIYDRSSLPSADLARSLRELRAIYQSAGINITIRNCPQSASCPEQFDANEVGVRLLPGTFPSDPRRLAVAFVARGGKLSTIYLSAVIEAASRTNVSASRVLGYAMAHEAAHLFGLSHSRCGVMKAGWTDTDYRAMDEGRMRFTRAEGEALHSRAAMNSDREVSSASLAGTGEQQ